MSDKEKLKREDRITAIVVSVITTVIVHIVMDAIGFPF